MFNLKLLRVIRPHIVAGGFLGYLAGVLYALHMDAPFNLGLLTAGYFIVFFMDLSTHFNNDYFDVEVDKNAQFKPFGNKNLFLQNPELMKPALIASITSTIISLILAASLGQTWHLLAVTALFNALGWLYSAPPVRLHSRRLGEATIAIGTGFCVPAVGYVVTQNSIDTGFILFAAPLVLYGFILSLCLQVPDYEVDKEMGKNTVVGLIGRKKTYRLVALSSFLASASYFTVLDLGWIKWISVIPLAASILCIRLSESRDDAKKYTKHNIVALFVYLTLLDIILLIEKMGII